MASTGHWAVALDRQGTVRRRAFLQTLGLTGLGLGLGLSGFGRLLADQAETMRARRKACILLWMAGGPSQFETFDPKPGHPNGGGTKAIDTAVPGIQIAADWERTARVMNELALVRSLTNREGNHLRATYQLHTGYLPTSTLKHPGFGSNVAAELGEPGLDLPLAVSIGGPTQGAGFLGVAYEPFLVQNPDRPPAFAAPRVPAGRFQRRLALLDSLESVGFARSGGADRVRDHGALYQQTASMVVSPRMTAFDLETEDPAHRDTYGRTPFGQGCLLARRLVETGVPFVEVRSNGWDTHQDNAGRVKTLAAAVDPPLAALVADLKERGLLDSTLVVWMGEFGRTPRINGDGGRDHFPRASTVLLAGGGVRGGQVIGATSADGTEIVDRPVSVNDLLQSFCMALGIAAGKENMSPVGRPIKIVDGGSTIAGLLG
jgi:hypothetical protein